MPNHKTMMVSSSRSPRTPSSSASGSSTTSRSRGGGGGGGGSSCANEKISPQVSSPPSPESLRTRDNSNNKKKKKKREPDRGKNSGSSGSGSGGNTETSSINKKSPRSRSPKRHHATDKSDGKTDGSRISSSSSSSRKRSSGSSSKQKKTVNSSNADESGSTMIVEDSVGSVQDVVRVRRIAPKSSFDSDRQDELKGGGHSRERSRSPLPPRPVSPTKGARFSPNSKKKQGSILNKTRSSPRSSFAAMNGSNHRAGSTHSSIGGNSMSLSTLDSEEEERPVTVVTEEDARFHNCIKDEDWTKLEKLLKKFDSDHYKRMEKQAKELKEREIAEAEAAKAAAAAAEAEEEEAAKIQAETEDGGAKEFDSKRSGFLSMLSPRGPGRGSQRKLNRDASTRSDLSSSLHTPRERSGGRFKPSKRIWLRSSSRDLKDPSEIVSPLFMVDDTGRTPLHLALHHQCPETLVLDLLSNGKKAALVKDNFGQLPLHFAVKTWQYDHVMEKIIKAYPNGLKTKDDDGRTPIGLAVRLARQRQDDENPIPFDGENSSDILWIQPALTKKDKSWQFEQEKIWSKVNFLLKDLMRRGKSLIPSEHRLLLEGLEAGANPNTINRLVSTTDRYLASDDELAGAAINLCVERQYCLDTLEYMMERCRNEKTVIITQSVQKALNTHYRFGCRPLRDGVHPFGKQVIDWTKEQEKSLALSSSTAEEEKKDNDKKIKREGSVNLFGKRGDAIHDDDNVEDYSLDFEDSSSDEFGGEEEDEVPGGDLADALDTEEKWSGMDDSCKQWWETMNYIVFFCAYGRNYKTTTKPMSPHIVHAALSISSVPPSLIQLLLIIHPDATNELCPMYHALPIHIACSRWRYDVLRADGDNSLDRVLKHILKKDPDQAFQPHKGRLPIHMALSVGQSWTFLKHFVAVDKQSVGFRDPQSKIFPFQMAALPLSSKNAQLLMRCKFSPKDWRLMSKEQKKIEFDSAEDIQERKQLGTIFELLVRHPAAVVGKPLYRQPDASGALRDGGRVALHYLSFVYAPNPTGGFRLRSENLKLLRDGILRADIPLELEHWWDKMKKCIWEESNGSIPERDVFLLHAALFNPDSPPLLIELLLQVFPAAVSKPLLGTKTLPLHIAAGTSTYCERAFESPYGKDSLQLVLASYPRAVQMRSNGRLPIHIALAKGKNWDEVRSLVKTYPSSLLMEDPQTKLMPFQLMATFNLISKNNALRYAAFVDRQTRMIDFDNLSVDEKAATLSKIKREQKRNQLTCIFELLRHKPLAVNGRSEVSSVSSTSASVNSIEGGSMVFSDTITSKELPRFLTNQVQSPVRTSTSSVTKDLVTPLPSMAGQKQQQQQQSSYVSFVESQYDGRTPRLDSPLDSYSRNNRFMSPPLSRKGSTHSVNTLGSIAGGSLYNQSSARPRYNDNDDLTTSLHSQSTYASFNNSAGSSIGKPVYRFRTPGSGRNATTSMARAAAATSMPIKPPDLGIIDIDDDDI